MASAEIEVPVQCKVCNTVFAEEDDFAHMNDCKNDVWIKALETLYNQKIFVIDSSNGDEQIIRCTACKQTFERDEDYGHMNLCDKQASMPALKSLYEKNIFVYVG